MPTRLSYHPKRRGNVQSGAIAKIVHAFSPSTMSVLLAIIRESENANDLACNSMIMENKAPGKVFDTHQRVRECYGIDERNVLKPE